MLDRLEAWMPTFLLRRRIRRQAARDFRHAWQVIARVFSRSPAVYMGIVGASGIMPFTYELIELSIAHKAEAEPLYAKNVLGSDAMLAAFCLVGLQRMHSPQLHSLAPQLYERTEVLHCRSACFGSYI